MKLKNYLLLAGAALMMVSCANDDLKLGGKGEIANINISLTTPNLKTKGYDDGKSANLLQYAIYETSGEGVNKTYKYITEESEEFTGSKNVQLQLVNGSSYTVIFWAASKPNGEVATNPYTIDFEGEKMTVDYTKVKANDANLDAFYGIVDLGVINGDGSVKVNLERPLAQINVGTNDYEALEELNSKKVPTESSMVVKNVPNEMNLLTGEVSGETEAKYALNTINKDEKFPKEGYTYLAMAYLLVGEKTNHDVTFNFKSEAGELSREVAQIPVQRNHRTNIYGSILTSNQNVLVEITPGFEDEFLDYVIWDGTVTEPQKINDTYMITKPGEWVWLGTLTNGTNVKVALTANLDFDGKEVKPLQIHGVFDGQNHVMSNINLTMPDYTSGLFIGEVNNGILEIKNLTLSNITAIHNHKEHAYTGAVLGCTQNNMDVTLTNVHVINADLKGVKSIGGLVGFISAGTSVKISDSSVDNSYIHNFAVEKESGFVGGLVGRNAGSLSIENSEIKNTKIDGYYAANRGENTIQDVVGGQADFTGAKVTNVTVNKYVVNSVSNISNDEELQEALTKAVEGSVIVITQGTYGAFSVNNSKNKLSAQNVTIDCSGAVFEGENSLNFNATTTIKNAIFKNYSIKHNGGVSNNDACGAYGYIAGNFENCVFEGEAGLRYGTVTDDVSFKTCKFIATREQAFHIDSATDDATVTLIDCEIIGYAPMGSQKLNYIAENTTFKTNDSGYGGVGLRRPTSMTNCKFYIGGKYDHDEIALKLSGFKYEFNGCTVNDEPLTKDYEFAVGSDGIEVTIDGTIYPLTQTGDKPKKP